MRAEDPRSEPDIERAPQPTIFDAVSRLGSATATLFERQELRASDALTLASRHSVTAGESCDGSTVADVCDIAWL
jgi:hypothetical protein